MKSSIKLDFNIKKVFISPHTPKTTMFYNLLKKEYPNIEILGFIDKQKEASNIFKIENIKFLDFDYIIVYSPNHFLSIYEDYIKIVDKKKIINIEEKINKYLVNDYINMEKRIEENTFEETKLKCLQNIVLSYDKTNKLRKKIVILCKGFIGTNNKALLNEAFRLACDVTLLSDNKEQLIEFENLNINIIDLNSDKALEILSEAKIVIQDQGNSNNFIKVLSDKQIKIQLWHGIPLKRMNRLVDVVYDYHISTSDFVNKSSLSEVIEAKKHLDLGYPRNDLLIKEHDSLDLCLVDMNIYYLSKKEKIVVYMPTHRESAFSFNDSKILFPLDLEKINIFMKSINTYFILKLHPFVSSLFDGLEFSNIKFYPSQNDIYPVLKYTDILVTDYSSVYFDFLLVDKPIIFFDYDYKEYSSNMNGFVYDYESCAPGKKVKTQVELEKEIKDLFLDNDTFKDKRKKVLNKFFNYKDDKSSFRIMKRFINE